MIERIQKKKLTHLLKNWPACILLGPRQCGKTTLARSFPGKYFDLELEADCLRLDLSWEKLIAEKDLLILDEAQNYPEIFPRIRSAIDLNRDRKGRFLLLGSVSHLLMQQVSESLAGRLAIARLSPFILTELQTSVQRDRHWLTGGYPDGGIMNPELFPEWQENYLQLLAQRDLVQWGLPAKPLLTDRLLRMLAAVHGQEWNASKLGQSLGLSYHTINDYIDLLEGAFLIRRLPAWHQNIGKRLVKRPKIYLTDSGILHSLLRINMENRLFEHPHVGASWEGYVIGQIFDHLDSLGIRFEASYLRTSDQYEIDLLLQGSGPLIAIEIKLGTRQDPKNLARLNKAADWVDATWRVLLSNSPQIITNDQTILCDLNHLLEKLPDLLSS